MKEWKRLALLTKEKDYNHKKDKKIKKFEKKSMVLITEKLRV